jgi:SAM-dependent methyltransferase
MDSARRWADDLAAWGIPQHILDQAPESPWIHPPALFGVPDEIPDTPSHRVAREALPEGGSVLDVGCGGGIAAFALVPPAGTVVGVDHQQKMLDMFGQRAEALGVRHAEVMGDWPDVALITPPADVAVCHHVVYNIADIVPFLAALNDHAARRVVIEMPQQHPLAGLSPAWLHFWGLERPTAPGPADLQAVLADMGIAANVDVWSHGKVRPVAIDDDVRFTRIRLCLPESRDAEVREFLAAQPRPETRALATVWWDV